MNGLRCIAGLFGGVGALILIVQGEVTVGAVLLASMMAFFVGESNGKKVKESPGSKQQ